MPSLTLHQLPYSAGRGNPASAYERVREILHRLCASFSWPTRVLDNFRAVLFQMNVSLIQQREEEQNPYARVSEILHHFPTRVLGLDNFRARFK